MNAHALRVLLVVTGVACAAIAAAARDQAIPPALASSAVVEQTAQGLHAALAILNSFDGIAGPRNPWDNSLAVGPDHIFQIVNSQLAILTKQGARYETTGKLLYGPIATNTLFTGAALRGLVGSPLRGSSARSPLARSSAQRDALRGQFRGIFLPIGPAARAERRRGS